MKRINYLIQKLTLRIKGPKPYLVGLLLLSVGTARPQSIIYSNFSPSTGSGSSTSYFSMQGETIVVDNDSYNGMNIVVPFTVPAGQNYQLSKIEVVASLPASGGYPIHAYILTDPTTRTWPNGLPPYPSTDYKSSTNVLMNPTVIVFDASQYPALTLNASQTYYLKLVGTEVNNGDFGQYPVQIYQNSLGDFGSSPVQYMDGGGQGLFGTNTLDPVFRISGMAVVSTKTTCTGGSVIYDSFTTPYTPAGCLFTSGPTASNIQSCSSQNLTMFMPTNSGTCLICVEAQYAALVNAGSATSIDPLGPASYLYRPGTWNEIQHLTLSPAPVDYGDGVQTPFRCLQCTSPPPGLVAWWTFDDWPWAPVTNAIPGQPDGSSHTIADNTYLPVPGQVGWAKQFDGISDYIEVPSGGFYDVGSATTQPSSLCDHEGIGCPGDFSIDAWVNITAYSPGVRVIVEKRTYSEGQYTGYSFYLYNGYLGLQMATAGAGPMNYGAPALAVPPDGRWHLVAVSVRRRVGAQVQFFMDGTAVQDFPASGVPSQSLANPSPLRIGMDTIGNGSDGFLGFIDEVEFFQNFVSAADFSKVFNAKCYGKCKQ